MAKTVYWCPTCEIPIIENNICPRCGTKCKSVSKNGICNPVFKQERKLLSHIKSKNLDDSNIWYLGNSYYLINGDKERIPYVDYYKDKKHRIVAESLRSSIINDDMPIKVDEYIQANSRYLNDLVYEAEEYIKDLSRKYQFNKGKKYIPTVSFSGGKDSTVVSRLVRDALQSETIIHYFGDTTLEFPATHDYVEKDFRRDNPFTPMIPSESEKNFFSLCKVFGPPSRLERWCCTIFKTGNLNGELQNLDGNSLTFLGIRHSESKERQNYDRTQEHSKIGSQVNAMPIIEWYDCDVWLYILSKNICFNNAYKWGYKRVGCWCCPNNSDWSTMLTEIYYPDLSEKWKSVLYDFAIKTNKSDIDDYIENGKWKSRKGASGLEVKNKTIVDTPCNLSDKARNIISDRKINPDIIELFKPFGQITITTKEDADYITIKEKSGQDNDGNIYPNRKICDLVIKWGTNIIKVLPEDGIDVQLLVNRIKCQLRKYQYCIRCSACDSVCPFGAINTIGEKRYYIEDSKCFQNLNICSLCIAKFYNGCITCQVLSGKKE